MNITSPIGQDGQDITPMEVLPPPVDGDRGSEVPWPFWAKSLVSLSSVYANWLVGYSAGSGDSHKTSQESRNVAKRGTFGNSLFINISRKWPNVDSCLLPFGVSSHRCGRYWCVIVEKQHFKHSLIDCFVSWISRVGPKNLKRRRNQLLWHGQDEPHCSFSESPACNDVVQTLWCNL